MKHSINLLVLSVLLSIASACASTHTNKGQSELVPVFRVSFLTPESTLEKNEMLVIELETLLIKHVSPARIVSTIALDEIVVNMHFNDKQSCTDAGSPAALAINLFRDAHQEVSYYDSLAGICPKTE